MKVVVNARDPQPPAGSAMSRRSRTAPYIRSALRSRRCPVASGLLLMQSWMWHVLSLKHEVAASMTSNVPHARSHQHIGLVCTEVHPLSRLEYLFYKSEVFWVCCLLVLTDPAWQWQVARTIDRMTVVPMSVWTVISVILSHSVAWRSSSFRCLPPSGDLSHSSRVYMYYT